jgi:hypothetical protein
MIKELRIECEWAKEDIKILPVSRTKYEWTEIILQDFKNKINSSIFQMNFAEVDTFGSNLITRSPQIISEICQLQQENQELNKTISKYSKQIKEVSMRNELINDELDKIMKCIPKNQEEKTKEIMDLKQNLKIQKEKNEKMEHVLENLKNTVIPSLKKLIEEEKEKSGKMDKQIENYSFLEQEYKNIQQIYKKEKEEFNELLSQKEALIQQLSKSKKSERNLKGSNGIFHSLSYSKLKTPKTFEVDIEDILPRIFHKKSPALSTIKRIKKSRETTLKSTDIKTHSNETNSFQDINTVSTNKNVKLRTPISVFKIKEPGGGQDSELGSFSQNVSDSEKMVNLLKEKLFMCKKELKQMQEQKQNFRKCKHCLIKNKQLWEEEKQNLLFNLDAKRKKWKQESMTKCKTQLSPEMSKILFTPNENFKIKVQQFLNQKKQNTPMASTRGLGSLSGMVDQRRKHNVRTEENEVYKGPRHVNIQPKKTRTEVTPKHLLITPRVQNHEEKIKKMEINQFFSNKMPNKVKTLLESNSDQFLPHREPILKEYHVMNAHETLNNLADSSNFKSFSTFLSYQKANMERDTLEANPKIPIDINKLQNNSHQRKMASQGKRFKKKSTPSKSKKKSSKKIKFSLLGKEKNITLREEKALKKYLSSIRAETKSKQKKKRRIKQSADIYPKKSVKTSTEVVTKKKLKKSLRGQKNFLNQLMKKDENRKFLFNNLIKKKA